MAPRPPRDPALNEVIMFGGHSSSGLLSDTWAWTGSAWSQLSPSGSPPARYDGGLAYSGSSSGNDLVLYGGDGASGDLGDTWTLSGTAWASQSPSATPGPLERFGFSYDPVLHVAFLLDGIDGSNAQDSMWAWNGSNWVEGGGNTLIMGWGSAPVRLCHGPGAF